MKKILFVCTGNSCRSVMAEGLFRKFMSGRSPQVYAHSAGVTAMDGYPPSPETITLLRNEGVDMSEHRSRRLRREMVAEAARVFVMDNQHREAVLRLVPEAEEKVHLLTDFYPEAGRRIGITEIPDPIRMSDSFYRNVFEVIKICVKQIAESV